MINCSKLPRDLFSSDLIKSEYENKSSQHEDMTANFVLKKGKKSPLAQHEFTYQRV